MESIVDILVMGFIFILVMGLSWCLLKLLFLLSDSCGDHPTFYEQYVDKNK